MECTELKFKSLSVFICMVNNNSKWRERFCIIIKYYGKCVTKVCYIGKELDSAASDYWKWNVNSRLKWQMCKIFNSAETVWSSHTLLCHFMILLCSWSSMLHDVNCNSSYEVWHINYLCSNWQCSWVSTCWTTWLWFSNFVGLCGIQFCGCSWLSEICMINC